jgi:hypothetical protein
MGYLRRGDARKNVLQLPTRYAKQLVARVAHQIYEFYPCAIGELQAFDLVTPPHRFAVRKESARRASNSGREVKTEIPVGKQRKKKTTF